MLRELAPAARGSQNAGSRNLVFTFWTSTVQPADIGWPTGNGKKLSCRQAQLGQATCLAVA